MSSGFLFAKKLIGEVMKMMVATTDGNIFFLAIDESIRIGFEDRDEIVEIHGNGNIHYESASVANTENLFSIRGALSGCSNASLGPTKLDKISIYINLLNESHRSGLDCSEQLHAALTLFKTEIGI